MKKPILLVFALITLLGCRTVKKEWLKENYTATEKLEQLLKQQEQRTEKSFQQISETFQTKFQEISNTKTESTSETETENTTVSGTIIAEDGKEKTATIGNTTIKSNGANITFETSSSKSVSKEFLENFQQISKALETEKQYTEILQNEVHALKLQNLTINKEIEQIKTAMSKQVKKSGFGFGTWLWIILALIVVGLVWYYRRSFTFLKS